MADSFFVGKVLAITGGASGMGLQAAKHLASKGCKVSIADVQEKGLQIVKEAIDSAHGVGACLTVKTDVRSQTQVEAWIERTVEVFGKIDFCANLAAVVGKDILMKATEEITNEDWDFVLGVNLTGMMNSLRAQIPHLKSGAAIVNFASVSGQRGFAMNAAYCASKHAVIGLSKCTAKKLGPKGIRLNIVCPGPINTPMMRQTDNTRSNIQDMDFTNFLSLNRLGEVEDVANLIEFLLSDKSSFITGATINIDGGKYPPLTFVMCEMMCATAKQRWLDLGPCVPHG